ncbi:MAG: hypothetical protein WDN08_05290 [Rhizomicrobium sp.]
MADKIQFKLVPADAPITRDWPCTIAVPQDGGTFQNQTLTARFVVADDDQVTEAYDASDIVSHGFAAFRPTADRRRAFFCGAPAVGDAPPRAGVVLGFVDLPGAADLDPTVRDRLLKVPYVLDGIADAYLEFLGKRRTKN